MEETNIFPFVEEAAGAPGLKKGSVKEHRAFVTRLEELRIYLNKVQAGKAQYRS